jgi:peptidoglycan LD-endopeptidase LytH
MPRRSFNPALLLRTRRRRLLLITLLLVIGLTGFWIWWRYIGVPSATRSQLTQYFRHPDQRGPMITHLRKPCPGAPFLLPSIGFVGFLFGDPGGPYTLINRHPGIDIFGNGKPGTVPVYAAYDGYLIRLPDWISSVIIRIPKDPLNPSRQIWTYYAHMASVDGKQSFISREYPAGTSEKFIKQGTLIGYQGLYAGVGMPRISMHLHFSVVLSDANGSFRNETRFGNTLDPSPYFGMSLDAGKPLTIPVQCGK